MIELADIFRLHGPAYRAQFGDRMLPSHRRAMQDIEQCRTAALGGQVYYCNQCQQERYSYHSCKNRHCPKCGNDQANQWLEQQQQLLLPVPHFLVTFTLPRELRPLARSNQKTLYHLLFRASSAALCKLAQDPRFVGGQIGMLGVLQTWTRDLRYHPHIHYLVTGGGLTPDRQWRASRPHFLVHEKPLAIIFRAKLCDGLRQAGLLAQVDRRVWKKKWVVDCKAVGNGVAAFKYLAPYIFRVALSNKRILSLTDGLVTFTFKESATGQIKRSTLTAEKFIHRFLQHVLPPRFVKVRYYGLFAPAHRTWRQRLRLLLAAPHSLDHRSLSATQTKPTSPPCFKCGSPLLLKETLPRRGRAPPPGEP